MEHQIWYAGWCSPYFSEKLVLNSLLHHSDVTAIALKNDIIFAITLQTVQILHIGYFLDTKSKDAYVKLVTSQKRLMTSVKLNIGQKMRRFWKVTLKNLKIGKFPFT